MRVLHVTSHLNLGGVAKHVLALSKALVERGHRLEIASGGGALAAELSGDGISHATVPLHTSAEFSPQVFAAYWRLAARLRRQRVDLIHAHTRVSQVVADQLSRSLHIPYLTTWHGFFQPNLGRRLWPCTGQLTIAISEPVRRHLQEEFRIPSSRIRLIPHGIDPSPFETPVTALERERLSGRIGLPRNVPLVGTVARLVASKGVDRLMHTFTRIRRTVPEAHLLIVGDGEEREPLQRLADSLGVLDAVHFAGALPDTRTALSLMSLFVFLPADQEGFGLSLLEAMASGKPIVAVRRGGGASWLLDESRVGVVVEPDDADALADAAVRLLRDREAAQHLGNQARAIVKSHYSLSRMIDQVEAAYRELVDEGRPQTTVHRPL